MSALDDFTEDLKYQVREVAKQVAHEVLEESDIHKAIYSRRSEGDKTSGFYERLETIERLIKWGVAAAGLAGAGLGSLITVVVQAAVTARVH